mgnify:CR=1 FL=1
MTTERTSQRRKTDAIEEKRARLLRLYHKYPENTRLLQALRDTLRPSEVRRAAQRGVFMSYNRNNELFTLDIALKLKAINVPVWMDALDINEDDDWRESIADALHACGVMILVLSPEAMRDAHVKDEYQRFAATGKIVVPVQYQRCNYDVLMLPAPPIDFSADPQKGETTIMRLFGQRTD